MERQMTLAEINDELGAARTNKKEFLEKLEAIIPWETFLELIKPSYYKGELGNKPYPLELMLRIFILQNVYNLADMAVMNEVIDSRAFSNFCGINSPSEVPDGDTIGRFRNILTRNGLQKKIFAAVVKILMERKLILKKGTIVDSTFIESPSSTKNIMSELLHGEEERAYGDSGYIGANKRPEAIKKNKNGKKIKYLINRRPSSIKKLSKSGQYAAKKKEHQKSSVRCKVEHVFAVIKNIFRYRKTRYRGLRKQTAKLNMMFALANLYLAARKSLTV